MKYWFRMIVSICSNEKKNAGQVKVSFLPLQCYPPFWHHVNFLRSELRVVFITTWQVLGKVGAGLSAIIIRLSTHSQTHAELYIIHATKNMSRATHFANNKWNLQWISLSHRPAAIPTNFTWLRPQLQLFHQRSTEIQASATFQEIRTYT